MLVGWNGHEVRKIVDFISWPPNYLNVQLSYDQVCIGWFAWVCGICINWVAWVCLSRKINTSIFKCNLFWKKKQVQNIWEQSLITLFFHFNPFFDDLDGWAQSLHVDTMKYIEHDSCQTYEKMDFMHRN